MVSILEFKHLTARALNRLRRPGSGTYHIIPLHDYQAIYFAIPKVANSSLKSICFDLLDLGAKYPEYANWKPRAFNEGKVAFLSQKDVRDRYSDYWKFCFVRNPWDRLVSSYHHAISNKGVNKGYEKLGFVDGMSFPEFVERVAAIPDARADRHFLSQHCYVFDEKGHKLVDFIGRFERLDTDLQSIFERLNIHGIELPHLLKNERQSYRDYYDEPLNALVARRYGKDINVFEYEF